MVFGNRLFGAFNGEVVAAFPHARQPSLFLGISARRSGPTQADLLGRQGRMTNLDRASGQKNDLAAEPFKLALVRDLNAALQIDLQEKEKGETMTWLAYRSAVTEIDQNQRWWPKPILTGQED